MFAKKESRRSIICGGFPFGGPDRIRTDDPHNANVMRSQLRYRPKSATFREKKLRKQVFNF